MLHFTWREIMEMRESGYLESTRQGSGDAASVHRASPALLLGTRPLHCSGRPLCPWCNPPPASCSSASEVCVAGALGRKGTGRQQGHSCDTRPSTHAW